MNTDLVSAKWFAILTGLSGIVGVFLLGISFLINPGPPPHPTLDQLVEFGHQNFKTILWGAWLQAVGPVFIVIFALAIVYLTGATKHLAGWMTLFGACTLMTVSLIEIIFYICALSPQPSVMGPIGIDLINSVQHLYFIVAGPAFFIPLGLVIMQSKILPGLLGLFAIMLGVIFAILGITTVLILALPMWITALGGIQVLWWLSASGILISRARKISYPSLS